MPLLFLYVHDSPAIEGAGQFRLVRIHLLDRALNHRSTAKSHLLNGITHALPQIVVCVKLPKH